MDVLDEKLVEDMEENEYLKFLSIFEKVKRSSLKFSFHCFDRVEERKISKGLVTKNIKNGVMVSRQTRWLDTGKNRASPRIKIRGNQLEVIIDYKKKLIVTIMLNNTTKHYWKIFKKEKDSVIIETKYDVYENIIKKYNDSYKIICVDNEFTQ